MGSIIQTYNLTETDYRSDIFPDQQVDLKGNHDILSMTRPD